MPWIPELFSGPALEGVQRTRRESHLLSVPFFEGLLTGELGALVDSFEGEPELHHPVRGRVKGKGAFETYVADTTDWLAERHGEIEPVDHLIMGTRGCEEVILHLEGDDGPVALPVAVTADRRSRNR